jgi:DNA invertase Pin-like site-specific DNA recombinase
MVMRTDKPKAYSYVRMSSPEQRKGDSHRRQLELSKKYAFQHGLELVAGPFEDLGVSAFKGANVTEGKLGSFLKAVEEGKIEKGSYLLVESLDRISRQEVRKSLGLFLQIIDLKINIVTLVDQRVYTAEKTDELDLIISLVIMSRGYEESRIKSHRIAAAWANKRANAHLQPLTAKCPAWLKLMVKDSKKTYEVIPDRVKIVESIFADAARGIGAYTITRRLNEKSIASFGKSAGWQTSSVSKILTNRAVLGEFQPHKLVNRKRRPDGEPTKNYFPQIISEQLFYRAKQGRAERRLSGQGRKGQRLSNLFSRIAVCEYCDSPIAFENKGHGPKGGRFLVCARKKRGFECKSVRWKYDDFEASFLAFVQELDLHELLRDEDQTSRRAEITAEIDSLRGQLIATNEHREKTFELFLSDRVDKEYIADKLNHFSSRLVQLENLITQKQEELSIDSGQLADFYESKERIKTLVQRLQQEHGPDIYRIRAQIAASIRNIASSVRVASAGAKILPRYEDFNFPSWGPERVAHAQKRVDELIEFRMRRYFRVFFKNGGRRTVIPFDKDPLRFTDQFVSKDRNLVWRDEFGGEIEITADGKFQRRSREL